MLHSTATSPDAHDVILVDKTVLVAFGVREVSIETFDAVVATAGDALMCVFFWGVDCFDYEMIKKVMLA